MNSKNRKLNQGFTIVEVMIVMAIAGLILLIVFLAVPALQRNSRNTQRRNDVANILAAINEYSTNNQGKLPPTVADFSDYMKQGFYDVSTNITMPAAFPPSLPAEGPGADAVVIYKSAKCNDKIPVDGAGGRAVAAFFSVETGTSTKAQCQEG